MLETDKVFQKRVENEEKRQKKYIPGLALFKFKPKKYWSNKEAQTLYEETYHPIIEQDKIIFDDCIIGMENMPCNCVDLVIADPPFGINFSGKESVYNRDKDFVVGSYQDIDADYGKFTEKWMSLLRKVMRSHSTAYVFSGWNHLEEVLRGARLAGLTTINHLIWKYQFGVFTRRKYVTSHYHILLLAKDQKKYFFNKTEHYPQDVWYIKRRYKRGQIKNGNTLPEEVVRKCIEFSSKPGDLVFDPFMGMATTAVAAKTTWRHYFGFEINKRLKPVIERRLKRAIPGQEYVSFEEKLKKIIEKARNKYPKAYTIYLEEVRGMGKC